MPSAAILPKPSSIDSSQSRQTEYIREIPLPPMAILRAAGTYFALVFGTGFLLGMVRVPLPRLGVRTANRLA